MKTKLIIGLALILILISAFTSVFAQNGEYIVKFYDDYKIPLEIRTLLEPMLEAKNIYRISDISILDGMEEHIEKKTPNIKYNVIVPESYTSPQLFSLNNSLQFNMINSSYAYEFGTYGNEVRVAVVDTGCNIYHSDLKDNIIVTRSYINDINDDTDTDVTDNDGHGTHVAGIITQVAPKAKLVILKCMDGSGSYYLDQLLAPIYDAVDIYECSIINTSWVIEKSDLEEDGIAYIEEWINFLGEYAVIVSAVGNGGGTDLAYPAACSNVIGVGSVDDEGNQSVFSRSNNSVTVVAPGEKVYSTYKDGGYEYKTGTSQATPFVSGLAALALSVKEDLTPAMLKEVLIDSCDDLGDIGYDTSYGYGLINGEKMIKSLLENTKAYVSPITEKTLLVMNNSNESISGIGIWAEYDANGNYIKSTTQDIALDPQETVKSICFETNNTIKFFLWDSLSKLNPLAVSRLKTAD